MTPVADESGAVALLLALAGAAVAVIAVMATVVGTDVSIAAARARTAADAAALAAMSSSPLAGGDGRPADGAHATAHANGATLRRLDDAGWPLAAAVEVTVAPRLALTRTVVDEVDAAAAAAVRPPTATSGVPASLGEGSAPSGR